MKLTDRRTVLGMLQEAHRLVGLAKAAQSGDVASVAYLQRVGQTPDDVLQWAQTAIKNAAEIVEDK